MLKELKQECIRLRVEERLSYTQIAKRTGAKKGTLSAWLQDYSLTEDEKRRLSDIARVKAAKTNTKERLPESKYYKMVDESDLSRCQKAKIAEAAILFRLCVFGYSTFGSVFDGDKTDWLVEVSSKKHPVKIQVKWVRKPSGGGLPSISLTCVKGHSQRCRYQKGDFDFIVGYDFRTDTAYVFSWDDVKANKRQDCTEAWDKLRY